MMDRAAIFAAGAYSVASESGASDHDAKAFAAEMLKSSAAKDYVLEDDEEEDQDKKTWWARNKSWALPTSIGVGAFLLGADAGRYRPDRSYPIGALELLGQRIKALFGIAPDPWMNTITRTGGGQPKK